MKSIPMLKRYCKITIGATLALSTCTLSLANRLDANTMIRVSPKIHHSHLRQQADKSHSHLPYHAASSSSTLIIFGDSLSDNGNTYNLLRALNHGDHHTIDVLIKAFTDVLRANIQSYALIDNYINLSEALHYVMYVMIIPGAGEVPILPTAPYWEGRFSNGKVWTDYVSDSSQLKLINVAFGGSWVEAYEGDLKYTDFIIYNTDKLHAFLKKIVTGKILPPSLQLEIALYFNDQFRGEKNATYLVWAGGNDYIHKPNNVNGVISSLRTSIIRLMAHGARNIVLLTLPDLGIMPRFYGKPQQSLMSSLSSDHNKKLAALVRSLQQQYPEIKIRLVDVEPMFNNLLKNHEALGFTEIHKPCGEGLLHDNDKYAMLDPKRNATFSTSFGGNSLLGALAMSSNNNARYGQNICENPDEYLFWDDIHPTTRVHALIAQEVLKQLS